MDLSYGGLYTTRNVKDINAIFKNPSISKMIKANKAHTHSFKTSAELLLSKKKLKTFTFISTKEKRTKTAGLCGCDTVLIVNKKSDRSNGTVDS